MSQDSVQLDQRGAFRIPTPGQPPIEVTLSVGGREIHAHLRNESSGGFGLQVDGEPPVAKDDIIEMTTPKGRYSVRVAYVRPCEDDSRIQVAEQNDSGEIRTILNPDEQEQFYIGVEVVEDLSFFQKPAKRRRIARIFQFWPKASNQGGRRIALVSLAAYIAFPTALFFAVAIAIHFGFGDGNAVTPGQDSGGTSTRRVQHGSVPTSSRSSTSVAEQRPGHSTTSSARVGTHSNLSSDELYEETPAPPVGEVGERLRDWLSESRTEEPSGSGDVPSERSPSHENVSPNDIPTDLASLTSSQQTAIRRLAGEARRELERGVNPEEVKANLQAQIREVLRQN